MLSAILTKVDMHIAVPPNEREPFKHALGDDFDVIMNALVDIDGRKAEASNPTDRQLIFEVIETQLEGSFAALNIAVKDRLRAWYLEAAVALAEDAQEGIDAFIAKRAPVWKGR